MSQWVVPGFAEERQLGSGASGLVVAAVHMASGTRVAIKYLSPRYFQDPGFLAGFRAEAQLLKSLADPHVVRLGGLFMPQGSPLRRPGTYPPVFAIL